MRARRASASCARTSAGRLYSLAYGRSTGFAVDPIEKKPLNHFFPGSGVLSFGTAGCNLGCRFCQNWDISKARLDARLRATGPPPRPSPVRARAGLPQRRLHLQRSGHLPRVRIDVAEAHAHGLATVSVTAGYVEAKAREAIFAHMDATNVDLKAFTEDFYRKLTLAHLAPVLETLDFLSRKRSGRRSRTSSSPASTTPRMAGALRVDPGALGPEVPLHFTAFHPDYRLRDRPPTPPSTLSRARAAAREVGLRYVYTGNVLDREGQTTFCPGCGAGLLVRERLTLSHSALLGDACGRCGTRFPAGSAATRPRRRRSPGRRGRRPPCRRASGCSCRGSDRRWARSARCRC